MRHPWRSSTAAAAGLLLLATGCAAPPAPPPLAPAPPPRIELSGCVGVADLAGDGTGEGKVPAPKSSSEMARAAAGKAALGSVAAGALIGGGIMAAAPKPSGDDPISAMVAAPFFVVGLAVMVAGVVLAPVAAAVAAARSDTGAPTTEERDAGLAAMERALAEWPGGPEIVRAVVAAAGSADVIPCAPDGACTAPDGTAPATMLLLESRLPSFETAGKDGRGLRLVRTVTVEARRIADARVLARHEFVYRGPWSTFETLAANDAAALKSQLAQSSAELGATIAATFAPAPANNPHPPPPPDHAPPAVPLASTLAVTLVRSRSLTVPCTEPLVRSFTVPAWILARMSAPWYGAAPA